MISTFRKSILEITQIQKRTWRKHAGLGNYNSRHKTSNQVGEGNEYSYSAFYHPPEGCEKTRTDRNPNNFKFSSNFFRELKNEYKETLSDYMYQIFKRLHRSNDWYTKLLFVYVVLCGYLWPYALLWKMHFVFVGPVLLTRIRDKGFEPRVDEVFIFDKLFSNPTISKYFNMKSFYVMDFEQEYVPGLDNPKFPEYRTPSAKFFNADMNITEGFYLLGDVESGATMRVNYKTMPYSTLRYLFSDPFLVYDMKAEINVNGTLIKETVIDEKETLKNKKIYVLWH